MNYNLVKALLVALAVFGLVAALAAEKTAVPDKLAEKVAAPEKVTTPKQLEQTEKTVVEPVRT
ncbi:MAG: hypothetical protein O7A04_08900, partial [Acidobacteria bacterium]|nr:hypothetical protein [Acidobacteriota bacterium]